MPARGDMKLVTEARRGVIVRVLQTQAEPVTLKYLLGLLGALHAAGKWPQASWSYARNEPYDTGLRQHLEALAFQNVVEIVTKDGYYPRWKCVRPPLRKHAEEVLQLKTEEGLNGVQIATRLGLSRSLVYGLINDPYGEKERQRKAGYCPACGKKKKPNAAVCDGCVARKEKKEQAERESLLPVGDEADRILDTFREEARAGREALLGVTPDFKRVIRWRTRRGEVEHVLRPKQSWTEGMVEIGLWVA